MGTHYTIVHNASSIFSPIRHSIVEQIVSLAGICFIVFYIAAIFIAFAKEKHEDELIIHERATAIVTTAATALVIYTFFQIILSLNIFFPGLVKAQSSITIILMNGVNPISMFILYIIIFRFKMYKLKKELQDAK